MNTAPLTRRQAIREARACADAIIDQLERFARGFDRGTHRDDTRDCDRCWVTPPRQAMHENAAHAFALSAAFAA